MHNPALLPSSYQRAAERSIAVLLNCYLREYAQPRGAVSEFEGELPRALKVHGNVLSIRFPLLDKACLIAHQGRVRSNYVFCSEPYAQAAVSRVLDWRELASLIIAELGCEFPQAFNSELFAQVENSLSNLQQYFAHPPGPGDSPYLYSEQMLSAGHTYHPAPKAREGMSDADLYAYSPELQAEFQLFYFGVDERCFVHKSNLNIQPSLPDLQRTFSGHSHQPIVGVHPWQARFLLEQPVVQKALQDGRLTALGTGGIRFAPTASVRTLYSRHSPYFFKQSLHMRLTNCVRKNAWYELESALLLDRHWRGLPQPLPDFTLLSEPAYTTVDLGDTLTREAFSTIFRDARPIQSSPHPVYMAASLFGGTADGQLLERALHGAEPLEWYREYSRLVVWPALHYYAHHGVVFEPHLQNTLIQVQGGKPRHGFFRDLEGTKLVGSRLHQDMHPEIARSLYYSDEQAWRRFAYCVVFNQLSEVIQHLTAVPAAELWTATRQSLHDYQAAYGNRESQRIILRLLQDRKLPVKANLITRFLREKDRNATYVWVENPLR